MIKKVWALVTRFFGGFHSGSEDDVVDVEQADSVADILKDGEEILWEGVPSPRHAWFDHDQLTVPGAISGGPKSVMGRAIWSVFLGILALVVGGGVVVRGIIFTLDTGVGDLFGEDLFVEITLVLLVLTLVSCLPFVFCFYGSCRRAHRMRYILTSRRALVARQGPDWSNIFIKTPVIFFMSALFLYGAIGGGIGMLMQAVVQLQHGSTSGFVGKLIFCLVFSPVGFIFIAIGAVGLVGQFCVIRDACKDKAKFFQRSFCYSTMKSHGFPRVVRLRENGVGDVILGGDAHWSQGGEISGETLTINDVGFLSVPNAQQVADRIRKAIGN